MAVWVIPGVAPAVNDGEAMRFVWFGRPKWRYRWVAVGGEVSLLWEVSLQRTAMERALA